MQICSFLITRVICTLKRISMWQPCRTTTAYPATPIETRSLCSTFVLASVFVQVSTLPSRNSSYPVNVFSFLHFPASSRALSLSLSPSSPSSLSPQLSRSQRTANDTTQLNWLEFNFKSGFSCYPLSFPVFLLDDPFLSSFLSCLSFGRANCFRRCSTSVCECVCAYLLPL